MEKYVVLIQSLITFFEDMIVIENLKIDAATHNDIIKIENCMKQEQVEILRLRGLEQKRLKLQETLGFPNMTFQELLSQCDDEYRAELSNLSIQLNDVVNRFKAANENAKILLELNLHKINLAIDNWHAKTEMDDSKQTYTSDGNVSKEKLRFSTRKI